MDCHNCIRTFATTKALNIHNTKAHLNNNVDRLPCGECGKTYANQKTLNFHRKTCVIDSTNNTYHFPCNLCDIKTIDKRADFQTHLLDVHDILESPFKIYYFNKENAIKYLNSLIFGDKVTFHKTTGNKELLTKITSYYSCTSCTEEERCVSYIKFTAYTNGKYKITSFLYHNHSTKIDSVKLDPQFKLELIKKIKDGVDIKHIYKCLVEDADPDISSKRDMINMNYLRYLKYRYSSPANCTMDDISGLKFIIQTLKDNQKIKFSKLKTPEDKIENRPNLMIRFS
jgi:predicted nucleic acid-binding protein